MNIIDSVVGFFNPKAGLERARARQAMSSQKRRYEGAAEGRRHSSWVAKTNPSVNELIQKDLKKLVLRSRELSINNPYAKKAPVTISNNVIGTGVIPKPQIKDKIVNGKLVPISDKETKLAMITEAWNQWADELSADYNSDFNFYGLQYLAMRTIITSGEVLAIKKKVPVKDNSLGLQILLVEGDYIDTMRNTDKDADGGYTQYGIKYNAKNKRIGYWLFDRHPNEPYAKSSLIDIADIIHIYDVERVGQNRGVPLAATTMLKQRDLDDYSDAELVGKKVAASFAGFITNDEIEDSGTKESGDDIESIEPGTLNRLRKGESILFPSPPQNPGYSEFVKKQEQGIAAGYLLTYEMLTGDLSNVNFSSGRMGWLDFNRQVQYWQYLMFIPKFCDGIFNWFVQQLVITHGLDSELKIKAQWTAPRREMIDPGKETNAKRTQMRAGLISWQEAVRQDGYDPDQVLKEITEDVGKFKGAGLSFDWSPQFAQEMKSENDDTEGTKGAAEDDDKEK